MSKLTKAKKLAKRQARKMAKRHSEPPKNANRKPSSKKLTGERAAGQWQAGLRNVPVAFVKASVEENRGPPENLLQVISSDDSESDAEKEAFAAFDDDLDSWLDQELEEDRQNGAEHNGDTEAESRENWVADGADVDRMADEPEVDALPADATMAQNTDDRSDSEVAGIETDSRSADIDLSMSDEMESSWEPESDAPALENRDSELDSDLDSELGSDLDSDFDSELDSSDISVNSEDELHISFDDAEPEDAVQQDYIDNVSDLDDDEIFALANNLQRNEDYDIFDNSNVDDYFTELIASGVDKKKERHQMKDLRRAAKRGALQLLWMKYPERISITEVIDEMTTFIKLRRMEPKPLVFPPLDSNANWYVKQFADYFNLTAKIQGQRESKSVVVTLTNGSHARPLTGRMISLTKRRRNFRRGDADAISPEFAAAMQHIVTEVLDNRVYTWDRQKLADRVTDELISGRVPDFVVADAAVARQKPQKGARKLSSRVQDGHIVGQNASEIHTENFGHRLLRQMGWEHGSGLGKERAGIVAPIPATVKLTRGGLGK